MQFITIAAALLGAASAATTPVFSCDASQLAVCCQSNTNTNHCTYATTALGQNTCALNNLPANAYCCSSVKKHKKKKHSGGKRDLDAEEFDEVEELEERSGNAGSKFKGKGCSAAVLS